MNDTDALLELCAHESGQRLPRWNDLPDLDLYMDQVLSLMERYLEGNLGYDRKGLTASMVNNYVKLGLMPPPMKKKYTRAHLARLLMICVLKASLSMEAIRSLLSRSLAGTDEEQFFDWFCDSFEASTRDAADVSRRELQEGADRTQAVYSAALRAQAEQSLARRMYAAQFPAEP